jgi:hypothetical protein
MASNIKKLRKVRLEYDNIIQELTGDEAERWLNSVNASIIMDSLHGKDFPDFKWKVTKKEKK